jgi:hypothetical protein
LGQGGIFAPARVQDGQIIEDAILRLVRPDLTESNLRLQLDQVGFFAQLRGQRIDEILLQEDDILSFFGSAVALSDHGTPWMIELAQAVIRLTGYLVHPLKLAFDVPRPNAVSAKALPVIQTPGHQSWPSGHAAEAFAVATLLTGLRFLRDRPATAPAAPLDASAWVTADNMTMQIAARIADNRVVAGVHYPMDSLAGAVLGVTAAEIVLNYAAGAEKTPSRDLTGITFAAQLFSLADLRALLAGGDRVDLPSPAARGDWIAGPLLAAALAEIDPLRAVQ